MNNFYTDEQRVQIAKKEYNNLKLKKELKIDGVNISIGYISQVINNSSGEQSFVITHTDRFVSPVAPLPERLVR
ncbi:MULTISPECIES: hypothetical protein [Enterococcus]|uniref:hypothetical protein n=1 Tax=Enterococcus TaxID=1350 RepID=UPI000CF2F6EA|nr:MULTISPECIES: hypothetical protein [Enterococcus]EGP5268419.1 hypothetical protein [Enterococcus faecium]EKY8184080.1 hypothetical protein [Enterococcus faecium]EME3527382.1 hypothetical protein [Enterococcus faecium]EMF0293981.1 hypothetical protein [Enterococcus faecium]EMF0382687.1 hypothetical protein [Enterococcus faecium]